jgi:hypothetical protein
MLRLLAPLCLLAGAACASHAPGGGDVTGGATGTTGGGTAGGGPGSGTTGGGTSTGGTTAGGTDGGTAGGTTAGGSTGVRVDAFVVREFRTCVAGDLCGAPGPGCITFTSNQGNDTVSFMNNNNLVVVPTNHPRCVNTFLPLDLVMNDGEVAEVHASLTQFAAQVVANTNNTLPLDLVIHDVGDAALTLGMSSSGVAGAWYVSHADLEPLAKSRITRQTAFIIATTSAFDSQGYRVLPGPCGLTPQPQDAIAGVGYSWVPKTTRALGSECATSARYLHEWLFQLTAGIDNPLSGFTPVYTSSTFPACGAPTQDPHKWFPGPRLPPRSDDCPRDPEGPTCGPSVCSDPSRAAFEAHLLQAHWAPAMNPVTNRCRDGQKNGDESGVDTGGSCLP